jgi:hypothetical protein
MGGRVGFLHAGRLLKERRKVRRAQAMKRVEGSDWEKLAREVLCGMKEWRVQHPKATFAERECTASSVEESCKIEASRAER